MTRFKGVASVATTLIANEKPSVRILAYTHQAITILPSWRWLMANKPSRISLSYPRSLQMFIHLILGTSYVMEPIIITFLLQKRKLRHRKVKSVA